MARLLEGGKAPMVARPPFPPRDHLGGAPAL